MWTFYTREDLNPDAPLRGAPDTIHLRVTLPLNTGRAETNFVRFIMFKGVKINIL
jgi:hypothetical protein